MSEELDSVVCDACGESILIGHDPLAQIAGLYYHDWCYDEARSEYRIAQEEARATMDKWEEEEV